MEIWFFVILFVIAFLYSSIGHGGASGYLALLALFGIDAIYMRSSALIINLFVAAIAFYNYYKGGYFKWKILLPFILGSIPMAYLGARIPVDPTFYKISLAICLMIAVVRMLFKIKRDETKEPITPPIIVAILVGALIGFFSGMIGIGGGIILSPFLILVGWANVKESAAISAAFIWLNSLTGLIGTIDAGIILPHSIIVWIVIGFTGGLLGSYAGTFRFSLKGLRYILATILIMASFKLFFV